MTEPRLYTRDLHIAYALINHDENITRQYFYRQCYPLFKSIYDHYFTDCECCKEFIDEIYLHILTPNRHTGRCRLESFRGESTLASWLKTVSILYCFSRFEKKQKSPDTVSTSTHPEDTNEPPFNSTSCSTEIDFGSLNRQDVLTLLEMMPNKRYSCLIRLRYLEQLSNEETAEALGMTLDNYYNKHRLAKAQYELIYRKEFTS